MVIQYCKLGDKMRRIIIIEEDEDGKEVGRKEMPYVTPWVDGYTCPRCGKYVGSMEVHPCNQPRCDIGGMYDN